MVSSLNGQENETPTGVQILAFVMHTIYGCAS